MTDHPGSLRTRLDSAEKLRQQFEKSSNFNSSEAQQTLASALTKYQQCLRLVDELSLFSPNEELEDISSGDLQYMLIHFKIAELTLRLTNDHRKASILEAQSHLESFLQLLEHYGILRSSDQDALKRYHESPGSFSTASVTDAALRRQTKIAKFKEEKELKAKLEHLRRNPAALSGDDSSLRDLHLTNISLCVQQAFSTLEGIAQELEILSLAPPAPPENGNRSTMDNRGRQREESGAAAYSDRVDRPLSELLAEGRGGPILSKEGRPLKPFTLLDSRQRLQQGVFRPDHSLPTMTIDEYLEEEKRRGGIIDGGGPQSQIRETVDEDDMNKADEATLKARAWDDFTEENPKGAGNRMNMG